MTVKDPYAWLASMWRFAQGRGSQHVLCGQAWDAFLVEPLIVFRGGVHGFPKFRFSSPIDYWNAMYYNLLSLDPDTRFVARYEDTLADVQTACDNVAVHLDLARSSPSFVNVEDRVRNMADQQRETHEDYVRDSKFDARYYTEQRYLNEFSAAQYEQINASIDADVASQLRYPLPRQAPHLPYAVPKVTAAPPEATQRGRA